MQPNTDNTVLNPSTPLPSTQTPDSSLNSLWRGREIHQSKSPFAIGFQATVCTILTLVGILIFSSLTPGSVLLGGCFIAIGVFGAYRAYKKFRSPDELEEALKYLTNQTNLDNLPEFKWQAGKEQGEIVRFDASSMTHPAMALKENGKTIAVAIKYFDPSHQTGSRRDARNVIGIFRFTPNFNLGSAYFELNSPSGSGDKINAAFIVTAHINAREGRLLESLLRGQQ